MADQRKVFDAVIVDLIQIGSLYQYLTKHWFQKKIKVYVWKDNILQPIRHITTAYEVEAFYAYLLKSWNGTKVKIIVLERDSPKT